MSVQNTKSGINRLFPFAKKKPNIPAKSSDKVDSNTNKQKIVEEKSGPIAKAAEFKCDVLTKNNDKLKHEVKICDIETPKKVISETCEKIVLKNDDPEAISKNKKSATQKSSDVSNVDEIEKPKVNYKRWNIPFSCKFKGKEFDKTTLTMQDFIYYNPETNPIVREAEVEQKQDDPDDDLLPIEPDPKPTVSNNCITPCIKVGVDGKITIDQETLTINETGLEEKREELAKAKVIEESAFNSRSSSYKCKIKPTKMWTKDETIKFYKCLMNLGTDFSLIQQYFPNRTRTQIKRKYKAEEKKNPQLINGALTNNTHYDSVLLENMFQEDEPEVIEVTENPPKSEVSTQPSTRKRRHQNFVRSDCSRMSVCAYMMEEEVVLKNKRENSSKIPTASSVKEKITALKSLKGKVSKRAPLTNEVNKNVETLSPKVCEKEEKLIPKIRRLQDFHDEYEENITRYEGDSNSE